MKTKNLSAMDDDKRTSSGRTAPRSNNALLAGRLDRRLVGMRHRSDGARELAFAEQGKDQSHQFSGSEHEGTFMFVFRDLRVFGLVEGAISRVVHPQRVSGFDEIVTQVRVGRTKHAPIFSIEMRTLM